VPASGNRRCGWEQEVLDNALVAEGRRSLNEDSGALAPSPILIRPVDEDVLRLTILMHVPSAGAGGGGPSVYDAVQGE